MTRLRFGLFALPGTAWPDKLGGGKVGPPRGVLVLGDLIDDGDRKGECADQWRHFEKQFGSDGTDGPLKYPVFEEWATTTAEGEPPKEAVGPEAAVLLPYGASQAIAAA